MFPRIVLKEMNGLAGQGMLKFLSKLPAIITMWKNSFGNGYTMWRQSSGQMGLWDRLSRIICLITRPVPRGGMPRSFALGSCISHMAIPRYLTNSLTVCVDGWSISVRLPQRRFYGRAAGILATGWRLMPHREVIRDPPGRISLPRRFMPILVRCWPRRGGCTGRTGCPGRMSKQDGLCRNTVYPACAQRLWSHRAGLFVAFAQGVSILAVFRRERCYHDVGALGQHPGGWRILE